MGWLFGLFGLLCLLCVRDHRSYIRVRTPSSTLPSNSHPLQGWAIPFVIGLVVGIIMLILILTGVIAVNSSINN